MNATAPLADRLLLRPAEAGALLSISETEVRMLIKGGELRSVMLRGRLRVPRAAIEASVAGLERAARMEEDRMRLLLSRNGKRRND